MNKYFPLFFLIFSKAFSQQLYTPVRAGVGVEALGTAPKGQVYAEAFFGYKPRSFWGIQAGLGLIGEHDFLTYSFSGAITYAYLLNPYHRTQCNPVPGYNSVEAYLEGGIASFFCDTKFNENILYVSDKGRNPFLTPLALGGLRFHLVTRKFIYILKVRYTPALIESRYASAAGLALGLAWR